jgi:hypothetical protein
MKTLLHAQTELHYIPRKHFRFEVITAVNGGPLACDVVWFGTYVPTFRRNHPPSFLLLDCTIFNMTPKMMEVRLSETSVNFTQNARCHMPPLSEHRIYLEFTIAFMNTEATEHCSNPEY